MTMGTPRIFDVRHTKTNHGFGWRGWGTMNRHTHTHIMVVIVDALVVVCYSCILLLIFYKIIVNQNQPKGLHEYCLTPHLRGILPTVALTVCCTTTLVLALLAISGYRLSNFHWFLSLVGCSLFLKGFYIGEVTQITDDYGGAWSTVINAQDSKCIQ